ncbi:hypothetical protein [uncultured Sphingomonas sp.]|uniref:hypothetical protein n=1 Tax=uncultured Sphingomonas sp. TaxID=158754 RepID=UPI0025EF54AA|nr:hypothetical protein [uncultured Sphingomonas sp.]
MFKDVARYNYPSISIEFDDPNEAKKFTSAGDPIGYFLESGRRDLAKNLTVGQAMLAVLSDFFNFMYEGLIALEKRKFVVSLALLRKPLKQNLLYLTIMLADDEAFFDGMAKTPAKNFDHPGIQDTHRLEYFRRAKSMLPFGGFVNPEFLHDIIFDLGLETGLAPLFDKAMHLVTGRKQIETEDFNLNFVFKNPTDNDIYQKIYKQLSYILLYALLLEIELFKRAGFEVDRLAKWYSLTGLGSYNGLFGKGRCSVCESLNRMMKPLLVCPHCDAPVRIRKREAGRFFTSHKLFCRKCQHEHDFPLFWLLAKSRWLLSDDGRDGASVHEVVDEAKCSAEAIAPTS